MLNDEEFEKYQLWRDVKNNYFQNKTEYYNRVRNGLEKVEKIEAFNMFEKAEEVEDEENDELQTGYLRFLSRFFF